MLYYLFSVWMDAAGPTRIFRYPSFRIPSACLTGLVLTLSFFPPCIRLLRALQGGTTGIRQYTPDNHQKKLGTPTMGGLWLVLAVVLCTLLWADLSNLHVWVVLAVTVGFGAVGLMDDLLKIRWKNSRGLPGRQKLLWQQLILAAVTGAMVLWGGPIDTHLTLPFVAVKWFHWDVGWAYLGVAWLVVLGTSHAVNLTDGLDGLAIGPSIVSATLFAVLAYIGGLVLTANTPQGRVDFNLADYLNIPFIEGSGELAVICAALVGVGIGFLWFNAYPATVFMGDVGALAIGGMLGSVAVLSKNELLSALVHGVFLIEALSVITQVVSFRLTGRRIFRMAPIHHHFELKGWAEPKIIVRFWIVSVVLALVSLISLKLR